MRFDEIESRTARMQVIWASVKKAMSLDANISKEKIITESMRQFAISRHTAESYMDELVQMESLVDSNGLLFTRKGWEAELIIRELDRLEHKDVIKIPKQAFETQIKL